MSAEPYNPAQVSCRRPVIWTLISLLFSGLLVHSGFAQSSSWDDEGGDNLWTTAANWSGDQVPGSATGDIATFNTATTNTTVSLGVPAITSGGITFTGAPLPSYTVGLAGETLSLFQTDDNVDNDADIIVDASVTTNQTVAANITLGDGNGAGADGFTDQIEFVNNGTGDLNFTGSIAAGTGGSSVGGDQRLWLDGIGTINLDGDFNETASSASEFSLFIVGTGEKIFSGTNNATTPNYLQTFVRDNATFTVDGAANSLGNGRVEIRYGTVNFDSDQTLANPLVLGHADQANGNSTLNLGSGSTLTLDDLNSGNASIIYTPDDNTANTALITGGTIELAGSAQRVVTVNNNGGVSGPELTIASDFSSINGSKNLIKNGGGTLLLSGTNNTSGNGINLLDIRAGTVQFSTDQNVGDNDIVLGRNNNNGTLEFVGAATTTNNQIRLGRSDSSASNYTGAGSILSNGTGRIAFTNGNFNQAVSQADAVERTLTLGGDGPGVNEIRGVIRNNNGTSTGSASVGIEKTGSNIWELGGASTYTGTTTITGGILVADEADVASTSGALGNGGDITFNGGTLRYTTESAGTDYATRFANSTSAISLDTNGENVALAGIIDGTNIAGLVKVGTGNLALSGANAFTGNVTINEGQVVANGGAAIEDTNQVILADVAGAGIQLGASETIGSLSGGGATGGNVDLQANTLTTGGDNLDSTFGGAITGAGGALIKVGTGVFTLNGASDYTGTTTVSAGTLDLTGSLTSAITVNDGATLTGEGSTTGSLTLGTGAGATVNIDASTPGAFTSNGLTSNTGGTHTINVTVAPTTQGNIAIFNYGAGGFTGDETADFTLTGITLSARGGGFVDNAATNTIELDIGFADRTWGGAGTSPTQWANDSSADDNWQEGDYFDGDFVTFNDTATPAGPVQVDLQTSVAPGSITFSNDTKAYVIDDLVADTETIDASIGGITLSGAGDVTINAKVTGTTPINLTGTGALTLGGGGVTNDYTGLTTLNAGSTLNLASASALGSSNLVINGGTIDNTSGGTLVSSTNNTQDWNGDFAFTGTNDLNLGTGAVTLGASPVVTVDAGTLTVEGAIGGDTFGFTKEGTGTLRLTGDSTFTGVVDVNAGVLQIAPASAGTGPTTLGTGDASVTLSGGTIEFISDTSDIDWDRAFTVDGDAKLRGSRIVGSASTTYRNESLTIGNQTLTLERGDNFTGTNAAVFRFDEGMVLTGDVTFNPTQRSQLYIVGGTTGIGHSITVNGTGGGSPTLRLNGAGNWDGGTTLTGGVLRIDSADGLGAEGGSAATPTVTTLNAGTLDLRNQNAARGNRKIVVDGSVAINLRRNTDETFLIGELEHQSGTLQIRAGRTSSGGTETPVTTITNDIALNNAQLQLEGLFDDNVLRIEGVISEASGTANVLIEDTGIVELAAVNTYSGATTIDQGVLRLAIDNALPVDTGKGNLAFSVDNGGETGTFDLNGFDQTLRRLDSGGAGSNFVDNTAATASVLTFGNDNAGSTWGGVIQSTGAGGLSVVKTGTGNATFSGDNTYAGTTTVNDGQLRLGDGGSTGSLNTASTITVSGDGFFAVNQDDTVTQGVEFADNITGDGGFQQRGTGTTILNTNSYTGETRIVDGVLQAGGTTAFGTNSFVDIRGAGTLRLNGNSNTIGHLIGVGASAVNNVSASDVTLTIGANDGTGDFAGVISDGAGGGTLSIVKAGTGTQTLSGANDYTGTTTAEAGTLEVAGTLASDLTIADGATLSGEGSTTGSLTLGDGSGTSGAILSVDAATAGAFVSNGLTSVITGGTHTVNFTGAPTGSGDIVVLDYGAGGFTGNVTDFVSGTGAALGARAGAGTFSNVGTTIVFSNGIGELNWVGGDGISPTIWDINNVANWTGDDTVYLEGDIVNFDGSATSKTVVVSGGNVAPTSVNFLAGSGTYNVSSATDESITVGAGGLNFLGNDANDDVTISSELIGDGLITKGIVGGVGNLGQTFINHDNSSFTGTTLIVSGDLQLDEINGLGNDASNTITIEDNGDDGRLILSDRNVTFVNDIVISNTGGNKTIRFDDGNDTVSRALTMTGTVFMQETGNSLVFDVEGQNELLGNTHVLTVDSLITSLLDNQDGNVVKADQGTAIFTNAANDFTGRLYVNAGTLKVDSIGNVGEISHVGRSSEAFTFDIRLGQGLNNGTLVYTGTTDETTDRQVRVGVVGSNSLPGEATGGGIIRNDSSNNSSLTFSNATFNDPEVADDRLGPRTLGLAGTSTAINEITGIIQDNSSTTALDTSVALDVDTAGAWRLGGANTYTGATTVTNGTLLVDGSTAAGSAVSVSAGATLGGTGTINGDASISGTVSGGLAGANGAGTVGDLGTLSFGGDLAGVSGATWLVDLNNAITGQSDVVDLGDINGRSVDLNNFDLVVNDFGAFNLGNTYDIVSYSNPGGAISTFNGLASGSEITGLGGGRFQITYGNQISGDDYAIRLTAVPEPTTFLLLLPLLLAGIWMSRRRKQQLETAEAQG